MRSEGIPRGRLRWHLQSLCERSRAAIGVRGCVGAQLFAQTSWAALCTPPHPVRATAALARIRVGRWGRWPAGVGWVREKLTAPTRRGWGVSDGGVGWRFLLLGRATGERNRRRGPLICHPCAGAGGGGCSVGQGRAAPSRQSLGKVARGRRQRQPQGVGATGGGRSGCGHGPPGGAVVGQKREGQAGFGGVGSAGPPGGQPDTTFAAASVLGWD